MDPSVRMPATIGHKFWRSDVTVAKACPRPCVAIGKRLLMAVVRLPRLVSHIPVAGPSLPGETSGAAVVGCSLASVTVAVVAVAVSETNKSIRVIFHKGSTPHYRCLNNILFVIVHLCEGQAGWGGMLSTWLENLSQG